MVNDLISDSITRIRNAALRRLESTQLLYSKIVEAVVKILKEKGYIEDFKVVGEGTKKSIQVVLKYDENGKTVINEMKRVSKPGRRVYKPAGEIKRFKNGYGTIIVSTSKGVLPNDKAFELGIGGEVMATIW